MELVSRSESPLTFTELQALLRYPRASLHGLLATLRSREWLGCDPQTRRFALGARVVCGAAPPAATSCQTGESEAPTDACG